MFEQKIKNLFKAYDLRGKVSELNLQIYYWSGYALVKKILEPENLPTQIVVGRDCRQTSLEFYQALIAGILEAGGQILPLGLATTDLVYAACQLKNLPGAMVTASHNPADYNGLKIVKKVPQMLGLDSGLAIIRDFVIDNINQKLELESLKKINFSQEENINLQASFQFLKEKILEICPLSLFTDNSYSQKLQVVIDCANGMGSLLIPKLQELYGQYINFTGLYTNLDGTFPNHPADPMNEENLQDLKKVVLEKKADFGIAMDGDADRAVFIDENGDVLYGEYLVALFAVEMLKTWQQIQTTDSSQQKTIYSELNPVIVYAISYSRCLAYSTLEYNGIPVVSKQGHTFIKDLMQKYKAIYGGEASGHHYFGSFGYMDSGALAIALFLKIVVQKRKQKEYKNRTQTYQVSDLCRFWQDRYFVSKEINFKLNNLTSGQIKEIVQTNFPDATISYLDGITVYYPDWKFTIRFSNTEPLLRLNLETIGQDLVQEKLQKILNLFNLKP